MVDEDVEYESDPEETKLSLQMRRRVASDDEDEDEESRREKPLRRVNDSDGESEGAVAEYEDELEVEDYDVDEEIEREYEERGNEWGAEDEDVVAMAVEGTAGMGKVVVHGDELDGKGVVTEVREGYGDDNVGDGEHEEGKKRVEPYSVPTAGAFYMHDDRFRDSAAGRNRRMLGGRRLWESKEERKWGHDKFEELTMQERRYDQSRKGSRGRHRGRGRNRGTDNNNFRRFGAKESPIITFQTNSNGNDFLKGVRGRRPRRYQSLRKENNEAPLAKDKGSGIVENPSVVSFERAGESASNPEPGVILPRKQASTLSITSPPFYPSGSSTKENNLSRKKDPHTGSANLKGQLSAVDESTTGSQSVLRGKSAVDSVGFDNLSLDESFSVTVKNTSDSVSGLPAGNSTQPHIRGHGRDMNSLTYRPIVSNNQVDRVSPPGQPQNFMRNSGQTRVKSLNQQFSWVSNGSQASSTPNTNGLVSPYKPGEFESPSESSKSKSALVSKGKGSTQGSGMGFVHIGAHVMGASGNMSGSHGDQNFSSFLPFMQFGGQHPGGMGVPAVGMAFPGYVGQPQFGLGNSEMTWLPVLAGAAGALGSSYRPSYISIDGSFHTQPSGQTSSVMAASSSSTGNNAMKVDSNLKAEHGPELAIEDSGQRQKNPRRYTEMKFDQ